MAKVGRTPNTHGDLPWRLGTEIMVYRGESGMTFKQFQSVGLGDLVKSSLPYPKRTGVGIVVGKRGKNKLKVVINGSTEWTTRNKVILFT